MALFRALLLSLPSPEPRRSASPSSLTRSPLSPTSPRRPAETFIPQQDSLAARLLFLMKKFTGLAFPIFWGVGFTEGSWGILPKGVKLDTVIGAPIEVPR